jgi:hypothetical protein
VSSFRIEGTIGTFILVDGGARRISGAREGKDVLRSFKSLTWPANWKKIGRHL